MVRKRSGILVFSACLLALGVSVQASEWDFAPKVYVGWMQPGGVEDQGGLVLGGQGNVTVRGTALNDAKTQKDKIALMVFAGIKGEGFSNSSDPQSPNQIKFSEFDLSAGVGVGPNGASWQWRTPLNISMSRDLVTNEGFGVRYAFSGLQVRFLDSEETEEQMGQVLEFISDVVVEHFSYEKLPAWEPPICQPGETCDDPYRDGNYPASSRTIFGLYSKINYELAKRGWGGNVTVELTQAISRNYTKGDVTVTGFRQFSGSLKNLRFYTELRGTADYDQLDPEGSVQGAGRATLGFSSRF